MGRFTQYPAASKGDYADATTFLIANSDGDIKEATLEGLRDIFGSGVQSTSLTIASADVLQLNSTPLTIVAAQGAGTYIEVISAFVVIDFNSAAYATNTTIELIFSGASDELMISSINASVSKSVAFTKQGSGTAGNTQMLENTDLQVAVASGDPTTGDSDIEVFILYRVIS